jgi:hypothetical protein
MLSPADFDSVFGEKNNNFEPVPCNAPACFVGSYPPVSRAGENGKFNVNTYLLQPDRIFETLGPATVRSKDLNCMMK